MKKWYQQTPDDVLDALGTLKSGLSSEKASQLLNEHGENVLTEGKKKSTLQVFLSQFADLLVIILITAAVISMLSGNVESTIVIVAVILLNAFLGTVQHKKAEKSLDSLKSLSAPNAKVLRDGQKVEISARELVPGDILLLEAGDLVSADGRILENSSSGQPGSVQQPPGNGDPDHLRTGLPAEPVPQDACSGFPDVCCGAGSRGDPGSLKLHCHHRSGHGNTENGRGTRDHKGTEGCGKPWLRFCHLLRQDRNTYSE